MFDWLRFFRQYGIAYVTRGPNVSRGGAAVACPFCGPADPSQHMVVYLRGTGWRCWRNPRAHSGRERWRLIEALLRCSADQARRLAEEDVEVPEDVNVADKLKALLGLQEVQERVKPVALTLPPEFHPIRSTGLSRPFWTYLTERRGYNGEEAAWAVKNYGLLYTINGPYRYRIIIPIYDAEGRLVTWTARSILVRVAKLVDAQPSPDLPVSFQRRRGGANPSPHTNGEIRYKTLPTSPPTDNYDGPLAVQSPGRCLLGLPLLLRCPNPEVLVLCEGPFDAIRISTLGHRLGIYGTCLFGLNITDNQVLLLERLMSRFRRLILLLDPDAELLNLRITNQLTFPVQLGRLPPGIEDPGALTSVAAAPLMQSWLTRGEKAYA